MITTNRKKKVTAVFTGADGSMGFKRGTNYELQIRQTITRRIQITYYNEFSEETIVCEYSFIIAFLDNWSDIRVIG